MLNTIAKRLKEPSSKAGLAVLVTLAGVPLAQAGLVADALPQIVGGIAALWAVFTPEQAPEQEQNNGKAG